MKEPRQEHIKSVAAKKRRVPSTVNAAIGAGATGLAGLSLIACGGPKQYDVNTEAHLKKVIQPAMIKAAKWAIHNNSSAPRTVSHPKKNEVSLSYDFSTGLNIDTLTVVMGVSPTTHRPNPNAVSSVEYENYSDATVVSDFSVLKLAAPGANTGNQHPNGWSAEVYDYTSTSWGPSEEGEDSSNDKYFKYISTGNSLGGPIGTAQHVVQGFQSDVAASEAPFRIR